MTKKTFVFVVFLFTLFFIAGCETAKVKSNKSPTYNQTLSRVLISVTAEYYDLDPSQLGKLLAEKLAQRGIVTEVVVHKKLELEDPEKSALASFKPTQVLNVLFERQENIDMGKYGLSILGYYKCTISDVSLGNTVWDSEIRLGMSHIGFGYDDKTANAEDLSEVLTKRLASDGLLAGTAK